MFLRMTWATARAGLFAMGSYFLIGETQTILTVLSLSAILTNGEMRAGGSYYVISRTVGRELGGAIGLMFWSAYSVGATFHVSALADSIIDFAWPEIPPTSAARYWPTVGIGSAALALVLLISLGGARWFTRINVPLFLYQFGAIIWVGISFLLRPGGGVEEGFSFRHFSDKLWPKWGADPNVKCNGDMCDWRQVFIIVFPAFTGIMEGANLSGDLKDPQNHLPSGTLFSIFGSCLSYVFIIFAAGGSFTAQALIADPLVMQNDVIGPKSLIIIGVFIATFSSALGATFGSSRIIQAIARDKIFPGISIFAKGSRIGDEPYNGVILAWFIAQACLFMGSMDVVSNFLTAFFTLSYVFVNLACMLLALSGTPNFRPRFRWFSWHTAALGAVMNLFVMFVAMPLISFMSLLIMMVLVAYVTLNPYTDDSTGAERTDWGDVRQAILFHQLRRWLLTMKERSTHGKLWRPSILLLLPADAPWPSALVSLGNCLKKGGLYIIGSIHSGPFWTERDERHLSDLKTSLIPDVVASDPSFQSSSSSDSLVVTSDESKRIQQIRRQFQQLADDAHVKGFVQVINADDFSRGARSLAMCSGLGAMVTNTVMLGLDQLLQSGISPAVVGSVIRDMQALSRNVVLCIGTEKGHGILFQSDPGKTRNTGSSSSSSSAAIDVWFSPNDTSLNSWEGFLGSPILSIQLASLLRLKSVEKLRVFHAVSSSQDVAPASAKLEEFVRGRARFSVGAHNSEIKVFDLTSLAAAAPVAAKPADDDSQLAAAINSNSSSSSLVVMPFFGCPAGRFFLPASQHAPWIGRMNRFASLLSVPLLLVSSSDSEASVFTVDL